MARSVLSSQFVAGLLPEIKRKVAGVEGNAEQLLTRARFEEAKLKELPGYLPKGPPARPQPWPSRQTTANKPQPPKDSLPRPLGQQERNPGAGRCYSCGATACGGLAGYRLVREYSSS